jgi:septal ring factor EnvC (AmiA/AmiB activator)
MNLKKSLKIPVLAGALFIGGLMMAGCGGVSEAQMAQLDALKQEVKSLQDEANTLKDDRAKLEAQISDINRKLAECNKQKEETKANLEKMMMTPSK